MIAQDCFPDGQAYLPTEPNLYDTIYYGKAVEINRNKQVLVGNPISVSDLTGALYFHSIDVDGLESTTILTPPSGINSPLFGTSIALTNTWIVAGAPDLTSSNGSVGVVFIYRIENSIPVFHSEVTPESASHTGFGKAVSIHQNEIQIVTGVTNPDSSVSHQIEIYRWNETSNWQRVQVLPVPSTPSVDCPAGGFPSKVVLSSHQHFLAVGLTDASDQSAPPPTGSTPCFSGEVWVFERNSALEWQVDTQLLPPAGSDEITFGSALDVEFNQIVIGAPQTEGLGKAYLYEKSVAGDWVEFSLPLILDPDGLGPNLQSNFGESVQINIRRAAVGFPLKPYGGVINAEGVVLFERKSLGDWEPISQILSPFSGQGMGRALALEQDTLIVTQNSFAYGSDTLANRYTCVFPTQTYVRGDLNNDEVLDLADPILLLSVIISSDFPIICFEHADCDLNGQFDLADAIVLLTHLYLPESPPAYLGLGKCTADLPSEALDCNAFSPCVP